jgi:hypothetical protein
VFTRTGGVWTQQEGLGVSISEGTSAIGRAVALSSQDGNTAITGAPLNSSNAGAAWLWTRSGGVWTKGPKLVGTGATGTAQQGSSVALSADGLTAIVGGPNDNGGLGAAWVFSNGAQQGGKLVGTGAVGNAFQGAAVALSADGNTALVSGSHDNGLVGAAWVFTRSAGMWTQQGQKLSNSSESINPLQGNCVALSADGNTAVLSGRPATVFTRSGGTWTQQGTIGSPQQGGCVALSGDGNTTILSDNTGAYAFVRSGGGWVQLGQKLTVTGGVPPGVPVALSNDGNTVMAGGPLDQGGIGAAWVFVRTATHDFNADSKSDILWYNTTSGQVVSWLVSGTSVIGGGSPGSVHGPWAIVGQRDFNGDGFADILWRNGATGEVVIWLMNGTSVIGGGSPGRVTTDWFVSGTGDFNGDGKGDLLWYNLGTGQVVLWFMNGASVIGGGSPGTISPFSSAWTIMTGDFNGDGFTDILWFNQGDGQTVIWLLNGTSVIGSGSPGSVSVADGWVIAGTGDFDGDGKSDILWLNKNTGQAVIWLLNGTTVIGGGSAGSAANPWTIAETGDFNGDGKSDILWSNTTNGQLVVWLLNGTSVIGGGSPGSAAPRGRSKA